ncbi:thioredoxin-like 1-2, chloroplastic [Senna tora]|uniref:Thioredoxin-like 1-2, chloroplastic n=1 Tax=Senna tora TaxID=362788 RepID=A0A834X4J2_9FABA|nr:thioredoxin-like 1-2, chloroplastic [Senna tora]
MACSLKSLFCVSGLNLSNDNNLLTSKPKPDLGISPSLSFSSKAGDLMGNSILLLSDEKGSSKNTRNFSASSSTTCVSRALRWWEKTKKPNMIEIHSAQELVLSLLNAGDSLVVVDFYSPGCGGCKALHPKICQIAEMHPNAKFLQVNYEKLKPMCHSLHIHVLPFFRFYRGAEGRVCSFSCTNATIKKFKDALAKHGSERCSLGPARGLDESEIEKLKAIGEIAGDSPLMVRKLEDLILKSDGFSGVWSTEREIEPQVMC